MGVEKEYLTALEVERARLVETGNDRRLADVDKAIVAARAAVPDPARFDVPDESDAPAEADGDTGEAEVAPAPKRAKREQKVVAPPEARDE